MATVTWSPKVVFGCDCIGIQYQQGLKDLLPASDLVEGMGET